MSEFALIDSLRTRTAGTADARLRLGIGDDAALWQPRVGYELVACCDTLIAGRHFPDDTDPGDIAWKALAVNLSDLAAMGADPAFALLALTLPEAPGDDWLAAFADGWNALAAAHGVALAGGDTTRGPVLSLTVTCIGEVPQGRALRRDGAQPGDGIYVTGTLGDAAGGLACWSQRESAEVDALVQRLSRPTPRLAFGQRLRGLASAAIDISDGLGADLGHVLTASGVGAEVAVERLPLSPALRAAVGAERAQAMAIAGGDDYELCFTLPTAHSLALTTIAADCAVEVTRIGTVIEGDGLQWRDGNGRPLTPASTGWDHFAGTGESPGNHRGTSS